MQACESVMKGYKSVMEIHAKLEGEDPNANGTKKPALSFSMAVSQIMLIDAVFSFDSIITAGGTADHLEIMIAAVVIAMIIMFQLSYTEYLMSYNETSFNSKLYE